MRATYAPVLACWISCLMEAASANLPTVDLGYETHRAISFDEPLQTYNFSNIRFAQAPVGQLRFAKPRPPVGDTLDVQDGSKGAVCPPSIPLWTVLQSSYALDWATNNASLLEYQTGQAAASAALAVAPDATFQALDETLLNDPRISEDCLFLDVITPKSVFEKANDNTTGADVIVYIYGGGFTGGEKSSAVPDSFITNARKKGTRSVVWVAMNYRVGALGFLAGPSLQAAGGVSNAGFYDQELAIEWVHKNIHKFGGDPNKITLFGGSAGGGSIMHHITAYGGQRSVKFQKAIALYPGWLPQPSHEHQESNTQGFLKFLDVDTVEEARNASSDAVIRASIKQMAISPSGTFAFGPAVDGIFAPALPGTLLANGAYHKNVKLLASYSENDGVNFAPADVVTDLDFHDYLQRVEPAIQRSVEDHIVDHLYPRIYDSSRAYTTPFDRIARFARDFAFACNTHYLSKALDSYLYKWAVYPALHGSDFPSLQYTGPKNESSPSAPLWHRELQEYFINFILTGDPNGEDLPTWPSGQNSTINVFNTSVISVQWDGVTDEACEYFQKALYY